MSDFEHELIQDLRAARDEAEGLRTLARRALLAAQAAQEAASGRHDDWIDEGLHETAPEDVEATAR